jgi:chromodomain-helicase-DNA-binding protein 1
LEINGVKVAAYQILETQTYFEPLAYFYPQLADKNADTQFQFKTKLKQTYWDCEWTVEEDKSLLRAIYEYGYGNWEWIKADPELKLGDKILVSDQAATAKSTDGEDASAGTSKRSGGAKTTGGGSKLKPQSKHLRTRIDYLVKVLQNQMNTEKYGANWKSVLNVNENSNGKSSATAGGGSSSSRKKNDEGANGNNESSSAFQNEEGGQKKNRKKGDQTTQVAQSNKSKRKLKQSANSDKLLLANDSNDSDNSENITNESKVI